MTFDTDRLRAAIVAAMLEEFGDTSAVLSDFIVVGSRQSVDDDGSVLTEVFSLVDDDTAYYRMLGLLVYALDALRRQIRDANDEP